MATPIRPRKVIALVGRKEAAEILGVAPTNMPKLSDVPAPLQERGIKGFAVGQTPLWPRAEIETLARRRAKIRARK